MECKTCKSVSVKNGVQPNGNQRYYCRFCKKSFQFKYKNKAYTSCINQEIIDHLKEGVGIRGIARLLEISPVTVLKRIQYLSSMIDKPCISLNKEYEMDEMRTYIGKKKRLIWIAYALRKDTKEVVDFRVGRRTNIILNGVIETLKNALPKRIYTDKLKNYKYLIDRNLYSTKFRGTIHIKRTTKRITKKMACGF